MTIRRVEVAAREVESGWQPTVRWEWNTPPTTNWIREERVRLIAEDPLDALASAWELLVALQRDGKLAAPG